MVQGKCNLLKPVDCLTGTFFSFSQYAQDLTNQYVNPDSYRCLPSKYIALNLDYSGIEGSDMKTRAEGIGNIFQNYFENSCTYLRANTKDEIGWNPENTRVLLFQTLQKFGLMEIIQNGPNYMSNNINHIGDINIYSYNKNDDGIGYNEIYCYIPNEAKSVNYLLSEYNVGDISPVPYTSNSICGYEGQSPFNGLSYLLTKTVEIEGEEVQNVPLYIDSFNGENSYVIGQYVPRAAENPYEPSYEKVFTPSCLESTSFSDDIIRNDNSFDINTIVILYDIVQKTSNGDRILYRNIPLGIYFTGCLDSDNGKMTNTITKYVNSGQIYNQGTAYGLRICTRFLTSPNSTEIKDISVSGSAVSEIAPVLEKMGDTIDAVEKSISGSLQIQTELQTHLSQFKNNKVNVPYIRKIGDKKYWFVNGKNTGAVAEYEITNPEEIVKSIVTEIFAHTYTKDQTDTLLENFIQKNTIDYMENKMATKEQLELAIKTLREELLVYLQGTE